MTRKTDLTNQVFGLLTAIGPAAAVNKKTMWQCRCTCGVTKIARADNLLSGKVRSCGQCDVRAMPDPVMDRPCRYAIQSFAQPTPAINKIHYGYAVLIDRNSTTGRPVAVTLLSPRDHADDKNPHATRMLTIMHRDLVPALLPYVFNRYGKTAAAIQKWCQQNDVEILPIQPLNSIASEIKEAWLAIPADYRPPPNGNHY